MQGKCHCGSMSVVVIAPKSEKLPVILTVCFALLALFGTPANAQFKASGDLKVINYPSGGQIVYGPLTGVSSMPQAIGFMLRTVHNQFGDRPKVGKFFQAKGSSSLATFFTLTAKNNGKALTGLVIVSMPSGAPSSAAVLYDDTQHFSANSSSMMKKLNEVWHPEGASNASSDTAPSGTAAPAAALRQTPFPDNSGSIGLPSGWRITAGYQGAIHAEGPNGSQIHYGVVTPVLDPNNPQTRQSIQMQTQGGRVPLPGSYVAYPGGGDPVRALIEISRQSAQKARHPAPSYQITSTKNLGQAPAGNCTRAIGTVDRHDGAGLLAANTVICMSQPSNGLWMMTLYQDNVPPQLVTREQATMDAIGKSYKLNQAVIARESQSAIDQIHQIGADSMRRAAESNAAFDQRNASLRANEDTRDRHNQDFSNYILDQTVVRDTQTGEHATTYNSYAEGLVKADPNRYQYVGTQDLMKGIDY
jgi:hypothetical protein